MSRSGGWALALVALVIAVIAGVLLVVNSGGSHPGASAPSTVGTSASTVATSPSAAPAEPPGTVIVEEYEFGFKLSKRTIPAGRVTFLMENEGQLTHNFDLVGHMKGPFLDAGQGAIAHVTLKPGTYTYLCDVYGHAAEGMEGTLIVTKATGAA